MLIVNRRNIAKYTSLVALIFFGGPALSFDFKLEKEAELKMIPKYCYYKLHPKYKGKSKSELEPAALHGFSIFGEAYRHMHHYCAGLVFLNRGANDLTRAAGQRKFFLKKAVAEIGYLEEKVDANFILNNEIAYNKGYALLKLGRSNEAIIYFQKAILYKPRYLAAHRAIFDYYFELNQLELADDALKRALKISPKSSSLKRRLKKLNAKQKERVPPKKIIN